jgi:hypothetical protein
MSIKKLDSDTTAYEYVRFEAYATNKPSQLFSCYQQSHQLWAKNQRSGDLSVPTIRADEDSRCHHKDPDDRDRARPRKLISDPSATLLMVREKPVKKSNTITSRS